MKVYDLDFNLKTKLQTSLLRLNFKAQWSKFTLAKLDV